MKYIVKGERYDENGECYPNLPDLTVFEGNGPINTGLLDKSGNPIYRVREPIGFKNE